MSGASSSTELQSPSSNVTERSLASSGTRALERLGLAVVGICAAWMAAFLFMEWPAPLYGTWESDVSVDAAVFGYAGELLRLGGSPFLSYWDHKGPLIHLINAAGLTLSGGRTWGVWLLSLATLLGALALAYEAMRRAFGTLGALLGVVIFAFGLPAVHAANLTEAYSLPFQWAAVVLLVRAFPVGNRTFWTGAGLGALAMAGALLRANLIGGPVAVALVLTIVLLGEGKVRAWLRLVAGGVSAVAGLGVLLVAYLAWHGAVAAFWEQVILYNFVYSTTGWGRRVRAGFDGLGYATEYAPLVLAAAGWIYAVYRLWSFRRRDPLYPAVLLCVIWLPVEVLLASASGRPFVHYFMTLFAPLSFLTALFASHLIRGMTEAVAGEPSRSPHGRRWVWSAQASVLALAVAIAVPTVLDMARRVRDRGLPNQRTAQISATAAYIRSHSSPGAAIFVWGHAPDLYFFSGRRPASRFIYPAPLLTPGYADSRLVGGFLDELRTNAPEIIVDATRVQSFVPREELVPPLESWDPEWRNPAWYPPGQSWWSMTPELEEFYDYVARNYTVTDSVGRERWTIYRRTSAPAS